MKVILVLGILASIAVGIQIAGAHLLPFQLSTPPEWVRGGERGAILFHWILV
ncbi:MAG: hypothetical protein JRN72_04925 [Nitrososphaerota archaeon]|nr:hypothetical protein [Nitrososphaerota archaeon]